MWKELVHFFSKRVGFLKEHEVEVDLSVAAQLAPLGPLEKIIQQFSEKPEAASLTKRKYWTKLLEQGAAWRKKLDAEAIESWGGFIDKQCRGSSPKQLRKTLAQTESNKSALEKYGRIYDELTSLRDEFPEFSEFSQTVEHARDLSGNLERTARAFDHDVPEDVKVFLAAIDRGGASIELLTEEVLTWLRENNSEGDYRIVR